MRIASLVSRRLIRSFPGICSLSAMAACGGGEAPFPTCGRLAGVWNVALDYGNGLVGNHSGPSYRTGATWPCRVIRPISLVPR
jgi:hypothetical protein